MLSQHLFFTANFKDVKWTNYFKDQYFNIIVLSIYNYYIDQFHIPSILFLFIIFTSFLKIFLGFSLLQCLSPWQAHNVKRTMLATLQLHHLLLQGSVLSHEHLMSFRIWSGACGVLTIAVIGTDQLDAMPFIHQCREESRGGGFGSIACLQIATCKWAIAAFSPKASTVGGKHCITPHGLPTYLEGYQYCTVKFGLYQWLVYFCWWYYFVTSSNAALVNKITKKEVNKTTSVSSATTSISATCTDEHWLFKIVSASSYVTSRSLLLVVRPDLISLGTGLLSVIINFEVKLSLCLMRSSIIKFINCFLFLVLVLTISGIIFNFTFWDQFIYSACSLFTHDRTWSFLNELL